MSQPMYAFQYLGAMRVQANIDYTTASILTAYSTANAVMAKLDNPTDVVRVSVNGSPMFHFVDGDTSYIATGTTFTFDSPFTIAVGKFVAVV